MTLNANIIGRKNCRYLLKEAAETLLGESQFYDQSIEAQKTRLG